MPEADDRTARRFRVEGRVQGVGFRWHCAQRAQALGLAGWVANRADGGVEGEIAGPAEAVERMLDWLREGPPAARVERLEAEPIESVACGDFEIRR